MVFMHTNILLPFVLNVKQINNLFIVKLGQITKKYKVGTIINSWKE